MARAPKSQRRSATPSQTIHKPRGVIAPRVQAVGPEHFGIVCVDCAKARSKWMLTDFYGRILVDATEAEHTQPCFKAMTQTVRAALDQFTIRDQIVVIERTGRYHRPVQRAFAKAGGLRDPHHSPADHQAASPARQPRQQDRRDRPGRHPARRRQGLRPARTPGRSRLGSTPTAGAAPSRPGRKDGRAAVPDPRTSSIDHAWIF
jgi:hypothetical protein